VLNQRLRLRKPNRGWNIKEFQEAIKAIWDNEISAEEHFNKWIEQIPGKTAKVIFRKGNVIGY
jgi:hypothetical protein